MIFSDLGAAVVRESIIEEVIFDLKEVGDKGERSRLSGTPAVVYQYGRILEIAGI